MDTVMSNELKQLRDLFEQAPIPLFVQDCSQVKTYLEQLQIPKNIDITTYLDQHPEIVLACIKYIKIIDMNAAALKLSGAKTKVEFITQLPNLFTKHTLTVYKQMLATIYLGQTQLETDMDILTIDKQIRHTIIDWKVCSGHEHDYSMILTSSFDNTELQQLRDNLSQQVQERTKELTRINAELRNSEQRCQTLTNLSPVGICQTDTNGCITYINKSGTEILATSPTEILNKSLFEFIYPDDIECVTQSITQLKNSSSALEAKFRIQRPDGTIVWVLGQLTAEQDDTGNLKGYLGTIIDMTEQHQAEEHLRLQQQQATRMRRFNAMGELASSLAHQLNQPLAVISSYAQECNRQLNTMHDRFPDLIEAAEKIEFHANRAGEIVHGIHNFFSAKQLQKKTIDINQFIKDTILFFEQDFLDTHLITLNLSPSLPLIAFDRTQLEQVLFNIVQNAIAAIQGNNTKEAKIIIKTRHHANMLEVTISDTGPGISQTILDNIFEPFFTTKTGEMGLGLAICRSIIEAHDGQIFVASTIGKGSEFRFTLPIG